MITFHRTPDDFFQKRKRTLPSWKFQFSIFQTNHLATHSRFTTPLADLEKIIDPTMYDTIGNNAA